MIFTRTGVILCTENYASCVDFYASILGLPILHSYDNAQSRLTTFDMGDGHYLMVETGGNAIPGGKSIDECPVWLRFNVEDVEASAIELKAKGVDASVRREAWGTVADFCDPDGNICSFRDEATF